MKMCLDQLYTLKQHPDLLLSMVNDCFNNSLTNDDPVLLCLQSGEADESFKRLTTALAEGFVVVLERQLKPYLSGALSSVTPQLLMKTSSAPLHNMHSERVLGMLDHQLRRSPNVTMGFIDGKVKFIANKTMNWLLGKGPNEQEALIEFAVSQSRHTRNQCDDWEKLVRDSLVQNLVVAGQRKDRSTRKKLEKDVKQFLDSGNQDLGLRLMGLVTDFQQRTFEELCRMDGKLVGRRFDHVWDVGGVDELFIGLIRGFRKGPKPSVLIQYQDEDKDDDVTIVYLTELLTDMLLGDVRFPDESTN